jgi:hypothetical protein
MVMMGADQAHQPTESEKNMKRYVLDFLKTT